MIIANRLTDGRVVFLAPGGEWVPSIDSAAVASRASEAARLYEHAKQCERRCQVVGPSLIEVHVEDGRRYPVSTRDVIRAFGPSVRTDRVTRED
jgi:hypothetical protein